MIRNEENLEENSRGQVQFCQNLIVSVFEKGDSPCTSQFPQVVMKRLLFDRYLKGLCNNLSHYGKYTINPFHKKHLVQTDDIDIEFSKVFTEYIKNIQHRNSHRANSLLTNDFFLLFIAISLY